jgi:hypothetical protein
VVVETSREYLLWLQGEAQADVFLAQWQSDLGDGDALYRAVCAVLEADGNGPVLRGFLRRIEKRLRR